MLRVSNTATAIPHAKAQRKTIQEDNITISFRYQAKERDSNSIFQTWRDMSIIS